MQQSPKSNRRRASEAIDSPSKRIKKAKWDNFCYNCHCPRGALRSCTTCFRVYHRECLISSETGQPIQISSPTEWVCEECVAFNNRKIEDRAQMNILLNHLLQKVNTRIVLDKLGVDFSHAIHSNSKIVRPMDIQTIQTKINANEYDSTLEFLSDIKLMRHCAEIVSADKKNILKQTKYFGDACISEVYNMNLCKQCYSNSIESTTWFTLVCDNAHLLVWARTVGYPYWPAKLLSVQANQVCVQYFGGHDYSSVSRENIFYYSEENPNQNLSPKNKKMVDDCKAEVNQYIENIKTIYGHFNYAPVRTKVFGNQMEYVFKQIVEPIEIEVQEIETMDFENTENGGENSAKNSENLENGDKNLGSSIDNSENVAENSENGNENSANGDGNSEVGTEFFQETSGVELNIRENEGDDGIDNEQILCMEATLYGTEAQLGVVQCIGDMIQKESDLKKQRDRYHRSSINELKKCQQIQQQLDATKAEMLNMKESTDKLKIELNQQFQTIQAEKNKIVEELSKSTEQNKLLKAVVTAKENLIGVMTTEKDKYMVELLEAKERETKQKGEIEALKFQVNDKDRSFRALSTKYDANQAVLLQCKELLYKTESELEEKEEFFSAVIKATEEEVITFLQNKFMNINTRVANEFQKKKPASGDS